MKVAFNSFRGLNKVKDPSLLEGGSPDCQNVDFRDNKLSGLPDDLAVKTSITPAAKQIIYNFFDQQTPQLNLVFFEKLVNSAFSRDAGFPWVFNLNNFYLYLKGSQLYRDKIVPSGASFALQQTLLGLVRPTINTQPASGAAGSLPAGTYEYAITLERTMGTYSDESSPVFSNSVTVGASSTVDIIMESADLSIDPDYYNAIGDLTFNVYRLFNGEYRLVSKTAVNPTTANTTTINDNVVNASLGYILPTFFQSQTTGNTIDFLEPSFVGGSTFLGISEGVFNGIMFAFTRSTLYWSYTNSPHAWPESFNINFTHNILFVAPLNSRLLVFTTKGIYYTSGEDPELLTFTELGEQTSCLGVRFFQYKGKIFFFTRKGLAVTDGFSIQYLSEETLDIEDIIPNPEIVAQGISHGVNIFASLDRVFINATHPTIYDASYLPKTFCLDLETGSVTKVSEEYNAFFTQAAERYSVFNASFDNYIVDTLSSIWPVEESGGSYSYGDTEYKAICGRIDSNKAWYWESGDILLQDIEIKHFYYLEFQGSGTITVDVWADGIKVIDSIDLDFSYEEGRILPFPDIEISRSIKYRVTSSDGTGEITEVAIEGE